MHEWFSCRHKCTDVVCELFRFDLQDGASLLASALEINLINLFTPSAVVEHCSLNKSARRRQNIYHNRPSNSQILRHLTKVTTSEEIFIVESATEERDPDHQIEKSHCFFCWNP